MLRASNPGQVVSPSICKPSCIPVAGPLLSPHHPGYGLICGYPYRVPVVKGQTFSGFGGKRGLFKFKGSVNLINLNTLDKPVKTL